MTQKEQTRLQVLNSVLADQVPVCQAAEVLGVSERHMRRIVPYDYQVHPVALNRNEQRRWAEFTDRIKASYARLPDDDAGGKRQTEEYRMLLIRRALILKRAEGKVQLAVETIREEYKNGDRWLVYCDNSAQLSLVLEGIRSIGVDAYEYWSGMSGSRPETLDFFERIGGVLVAIKCLDEGVDLPRSIEL